MLRNVCYFQIFFTPLYFLLYFQDTTDYFLAAGFITVIVSSGMLLKDIESLNKLSTFTKILVILMGAFILQELFSLISLFGLLELEYLTFKMGTYVILTIIYLGAMMFEVFSAGKSLFRKDVN